MLSEAGDQGERLLISSPVSIGGDSRVEVVVPGLDNPAKAGPHTLVVQTSSDRARSVGYTTAAPSHAVVDLTLAVTSPAARASEVTYTVEFTTSASGALPAASGAITMEAAVGTFPSAPPCGQAVATVTDLTSKASGQVDLCETEQATVSQGGAKLELLTPVARRGRATSRNCHNRVVQPEGARPCGIVPGHLVRRDALGGVHHHGPWHTRGGSVGGAVDGGGQGDEGDLHRRFHDLGRGRPGRRLGAN